jgi:NTP pyrophosphatase (non-canonical NTP hydrolase)
MPYRSPPSGANQAQEVHELNIEDMMSAIACIDDWLDAEVSDEYKVQPLAQDLARVAKAGEEAGEALEAFLGYTGQNPRKGKNKTLDDVLDELADFVLTGVLGIQHFTKDQDETLAILAARLQYRISKLPEEYRPQ